MPDLARASPVLLSGAKELNTIAFQENFSEICAIHSGRAVLRKIRKKYMKYRVLSLLAFAGILFSSCVKENFPAEGGSILAVMENEDTRTSVTDEGRFTWSEGDQVWLHTTSEGVVGTLSSGAGTASANFSYGSYVGEMTGKSVYPYNEGHSISDDVLSLVMPSSYDLGSALTNPNAAMYGVLSDGRLKFNHMAGVMRFKFKNVPTGVNRFTITLDKKISGTFTGDLTEAFPVIETSDDAAEAEKTITLNFNALTETSDIALYIPLPLGTYNSLDLALYAGTNSVWTYSKSVTNTIARKSLKLMPAVTLGGTIGGDIEGGESGENPEPEPDPAPEQPDPDVPANGDLSTVESANSYIVSEAGAYKFRAVKGNSSESVGAVSSAEVLWESFGTSTRPSVGDLIKSVSYKDGSISFQTADTFKEGNAVIAAKDAEGNILWSWHIWLTDEPKGQVYYNNAGTMMDRNLGATSATPGDVGALGLLYQWGRKDPFLGSSSIHYESMAETRSTITWPSVASSNSSIGTIEYATANPTTFIKYNDSNSDWYYTGNSSTDNTRWTTSESSKSVYDPCPSGWRVPDGGDNGVWSTALGSSSSFSDVLLYDSTYKGMNFFGKVGSDQTIWYPASGYRQSNDGSLNFVGESGRYWSASPGNYYAYSLIFVSGGAVGPSGWFNRADGRSIRCLQE